MHWHRQSGSVSHSCGFLRQYFTDKLGETLFRAYLWKHPTRPKYASLAGNNLDSNEFIH